MKQQLEQASEDMCLYYLGFQKRLEQGVVEEPFDDVLCSLCTPNHQSAIYCPHFMSRKHLEYFKKFNLTP